MPYIDQSARDSLDGEIDALSDRLCKAGWKVGDVNYAVFRVMLAWFKSEPRYKTICNIMGTLTCVAQEFYRKVAGPYEDKAEEKNGKIT